ncbi:MAG: protein kinase [Acidobacteriota bacterium]|nr:protein kinase [Acidobacteriota bacterium]
MPLTPGTRLGPYEILTPIGAGGMGEVYRARDARLEREVAVKVLPAAFSEDADRLRRFEQEARSASALNHPNILTIHDIGTHDGAPYVVSEVLEGETLRDRLAGAALPARKAIDYAIQIAHGLAAAHEKGIVHRDLKPENLFVTKDGRVKILDFGLAKLTRQEAPSGDETSAPTLPGVTEPGIVLGTVGYMSPEQVRGLAVDARSDIFSFGAILYEMLAGKAAFAGTTAADRMSAILKEAPAELAQSVAGTSPSLERIVRRCIEKSPEERFQSARDLAFALAEATSASLAPASVGLPLGLRTPRFRIASLVVGLAALLALLIAVDPGGLRKRLLGRAPPGRIESIAVLPLQNLSGDPGQDYFADGMTEALIADLAEIRALRVISRSSVEQYRDRKKPPRQIARELGVDVLVEGSVTRSGERVRITAQLIQGKSDTHLWAKTYQRDLRDILELQGEVARAVAREIEAEITPEERAHLERGRAIDARAYEAYLQGRFFLGQGGEEGLRKAFEFFQKALAIEPNYAAAHSGLASYHAILPFYSQLSPAQVFPQARAAAQRAVELDEKLAEAHASLAYIRAYYEWDWTAAQREFRRALELQPSYADAHFSYSRFLAASGRLEEALAEIGRARELDPMSAPLKANTALLSYFGGQYDKALEGLLEIRKLDPELPLVHWGIGLVYEQKGMYQEAIASLRKATTLSKSLNLKSSLGHAYAVAGKRGEARAILDEVTERSRRSYVPSYFSALLYAGLEEKDRAFEWLERAYQERSTVLAYLQLDPRLANLRGDPRFSDILRRIGFPAVKTTSLEAPEK